MLAITQGTTNFRAISSPDDLLANEVAFSGDFVFSANPAQPFMVWDSGLNNVRAMTQTEIAALPAQKQAAADAAEPDLATLRNQAQAALDNNTTYLAIASPNNTQVVAQVRALTQQHQAMIRALKRLAVLTLS